MKKILLLIAAVIAGWQSFAQLEVIDTNNITRERWRDSVFRIDKNQVPTGFLLEYSMFSFKAVSMMTLASHKQLILVNFRQMFT